MAETLRPIAKGLIKQALNVYDAAKQSLTKAGERFEDLVAEARKEMKKGKPSRSSKREKGNR